MGKDMIWARFFEDRAEIGFSERGEHPADVDILYDVNMLEGRAAANANQAILTTVGILLYEWIGTGQGQPEMDSGSGDEIPF